MTATRADRSDSGDDQKTGIWSRYRLVLLALGLVVLVAAALVPGWVAAHHDATSAQHKAAGLAVQVAEAQSARARDTGKAISAATGVDTARTANDTAILDDFARTALSWSSAAQYDRARALLVSQYGLAAKSQFLTGFMPAAACNTDAAGVSYCYLDAVHLSSVYGGIVSLNVVSQLADAYSYQVVADVLARQDDVADGTGQNPLVGEHQVLLSVTVNAAGVLSDVSAVSSYGPASGPLG